jgi:PAS domain S-box-containing protein
MSADPILKPNEPASAPWRSTAADDPQALVESLRRRIDQLEAELASAKAAVPTAARLLDEAEYGYGGIAGPHPQRADSQNEDIFRLLVQGVQDYGVVMLDRNGHIESCNAEALRIQGIQDEQAIVGRHFSCFYTPEDIAAGKPQEDLATAAQQGQIEEEDHRIRANGERFWALAMIRALRDEQGRLRGFAKVVRDITARKRHDDRSRLMVDLALNAMVLVNKRGVIVQVNPQTEKMFGYASDELVDRPVELLVPERFRSRHPAFRSRFFANPAVTFLGGGRDLYGRRKDGSEFPVEIGLNPIRTDDGLLVVASVVDITQRKRAEEKFRLAVESAPSGMVMSNRDGEIVLVNLQTEKMFGYPRDALLGQPIEILVPDRYRAKHPHYRDVFFAKPAARPMGAGRDLRGRRRDGSEFPVEIGLTPIETEEGLFVLSSIVDITERQQAEDRSHRHLAEMAHAGRLMTVGEMFSGLAHEINQPLAAAANYARACVRIAQSDSGATNEQLVEWMTKTVEQAARASEIVNRVGSFVKRDRSAHEILDVNRVIEHVISLPIADVGPENGHRAAPQTELAESLPKVRADRVQIEQVLINLIRNAIESMADTPPDERFVMVRTGIVDDCVQVSVSDSGHGISDGHMAQLFEPFFTTKENGMGLGLSISRSIIQAHSGRLSAEPNGGRGTTFRFSLPIVNEERW